MPVNILAKTLGNGKQPRKSEHNKRAKQALGKEYRGLQPGYHCINSCLEKLVLDRKRLPTIKESDLSISQTVN